MSFLQCCRGCSFSPDELRDWGTSLGGRKLFPEVILDSSLAYGKEPEGEKFGKRYKIYNLVSKK